VAQKNRGRILNVYKRSNPADLKAGKRPQSGKKKETPPSTGELRRPGKKKKAKTLIQQEGKRGMFQKNKKGGGRCTHGVRMPRKEKYDHKEDFEN